MELDVIFRMNS